VLETGSIYVKCGPNAHYVMCVWKPSFSSSEITINISVFSWGYFQNELLNESVFIANTKSLCTEQK
jgi:hypothetical protein